RAARLRALPRAPGGRWGIPRDAHRTPRPRGRLRPRPPARPRRRAAARDLHPAQRRALAEALARDPQPLDVAGAAARAGALAGPVRGALMGGQGPAPAA